MNYLIQGNEDKEKIEILISNTSIKSANIIAAIIDHFCLNMTKSEAAILNNVKLGNLSRDIAKINHVAKGFERIKELDWPKYKELKEKAALSNL